MRPSGVSWPNAPQGSSVPNTKYGAITKVGNTHAKSNYNRKNPQTQREFQEGQRNVAYSKFTEGPLANAFSRITLGPRGGKSRRRYSKKHRKTRKHRKN